MPRRTTTQIIDIHRLLLNYIKYLLQMHNPRSLLSPSDYSGLVISTDTFPFISIC